MMAAARIDTEHAFTHAPVMLGDLVEHVVHPVP